MRKSVVLCLVSLFVVCAVGASGLKAPSIKVGTDHDAMLQRQELHRLHTKLMAQQVELGIKNPIVVELDASMQKALAEEVNWPMRVGVVAPVSAKVAFDVDSRAVSKSATVQPVGAIRRLGDSMVWSGAVKAYGATGIRLFITGLDLPKGAELAIYNERGEAFAYTGKGPFGNGELWTHTVTGGIAYLQLSGVDITKVSFTIADLGYLGDKWVVGAHAGTQKSFCSYNESCIENANCSSTSSAVNDARDGVAHMQWVKRPYLYICSGGLISNQAGKPYFLTANHCISKDREAESLESYFFYEIDCNDPCPAQWSQPDTPRTLGATVAATNSTGDYTILELGEAAPAGTVMMGWDSTAIAYTNGANLYRISHPSGAPQAYSTHSVDTSAGTCTSWPRGSWIYSRDTYGATEGGSSGSPVVNSNGDIVGQLSGGCGTNVNEVCDAVSNATVDGAFASYYNEVSSLLGGGGCIPVPEICDDGIDNDCDGLIDGDDPDCGGGECKLKGEACTENSECCSLRCHPVKHTCS